MGRQLLTTDSWYSRNKARHREASARWWARNKEKAKGYQKVYRERHPKRSTATEFARKLRKYGLTSETYAALLQAQGERCAICACPQRAQRRFAVDHAHTTNEVRGLLCDACNVGLGMFLDDPTLLRFAASYLDGQR